MKTLHRVVGMILVFLLLASTGILVLSPTRTSKAEGGNPQQGKGPGSPPHWETSRQEATPTVLSPPWQSPISGPVGGSEEEGPPIEPELSRALLEAEPDEHLRIIVHLREQTDLKAVAAGASSATEARTRVVSTLQVNAARSQAPLRAYLEGAQAARQVDSYTSFWIFNGIAVSARPSLIYALAAHPTVAAVHLDHYRQWLTAETPNLKPQTPNSPFAILT